MRLHAGSLGRGRGGGRDLVAAVIGAIAAEHKYEVIGTGTND